MVYISNGNVVDKEPFTWRTPLKFLWKLLSFVVEFFLTLFGLEHYWRNTRINRYFMGTRGYYYGDDHGPGGGGGGGPGSGSGGGGGRGPRRIATLPRYGGSVMPSCPGGSCGR